MSYRELFKNPPQGGKPTLLGRQLTSNALIPLPRAEGMNQRDNAGTYQGRKTPIASSSISLREGNLSARENQVASVLDYRNRRGR